MARTDTLPHFLTDVADAIRTKKGSEDTIQASNFDTEIANLPSGGGVDLDDYFVTEFEGNTGLSLIKKIPDITITDGWENIASLLEGFINLTEASITFEDDIADLINIDGLCAYCSQLTTFTINGNYDFAGITSMSYMFAECGSIQQLDLSKLHCSALESADSSFYGCVSLEFLDVRNIDFTSLVNYEGLFGSESDSFNPDCVIVVADATQKDWIETNFDYLTGVVTVAEYEAE